MIIITEKYKKLIFLSGFVVIRLIRFALLYFLVWVFDLHLLILFTFATPGDVFFSSGISKYYLYSFFSSFYIIVEIIIVILIIYNVRKFLLKGIFNDLGEKWQRFVPIEKSFFVFYFIVVWLAVLMMMILSLV